MKLPIIPLTAPASITTDQLRTLRDHVKSYNPTDHPYDRDRACESSASGLDEEIAKRGD